jgi:hypothetical protein
MRKSCLKNVDEINPRSLYSKISFFHWRSSRTDSNLLDILCAKLDFEPILFSSNDDNGIPYYHTNVMLWIGDKVAAVCDQSIPDEKVSILVFFLNLIRKIFYPS